MQEQTVPVLIFAQSGRYLAESATQAGHTVWVADCYGDIDTQNISDRWQKLPPFSELDNAHLLKLLTHLANGQNCVLICGSGIEKYFPILDHLPANINHIGNNSKTIQHLKKPQLFFSLLTQYDLPFPTTQFYRPKIIDGWLFKENSGLGGTHIRQLSMLDSESEGYYQLHIVGNSGSVLFLANGHQTQLLSINKQIISGSKTIPFQLAAIETPLKISQSHHQTLNKAIEIITQETGLVGLNSLDFIIDNNEQLFILEINPRPSASSELIANQHLFQWHLQACQGILPEDISISSDKSVGLYYVYAPYRLKIPTNLSWPSQSHDHPHPDTIIEPNQPICSLLITESDIEHCQKKQHFLSLEILQQLPENA